MNGFGYGGTNAHAILVEAPEPTAPAVRQAPARGAADVRTQRGGRPCAGPGVARRSSPTRRVDPAALADTMWSRRSHHNYRFAVPFGDRDDLRARLAAVVDGSVAGGRTVTDGTAPVFVFSGMGPQWWRMGRDLLDAGGPFARAAAELDEVVRRPRRLVGDRRTAPRRSRLPGDQHRGRSTRELPGAGRADRGTGALRRAARRPSSDTASAR